MINFSGFCLLFKYLILNPPVKIRKKSKQFLSYYSAKTKSLKNIRKNEKIKCTYIYDPDFDQFQGHVSV
jgi:hypothetical protein